MKSAFLTLVLASLATVTIASDKNEYIFPSKDVQICESKQTVCFLKNGNDDCDADFTACMSQLSSDKKG